MLSFRTNIDTTFTMIFIVLYTHHVNVLFPTGGSDKPQQSDIIDQGGIVEVGVDQQEDDDDDEDGVGMEDIEVGVDLREHCENCEDGEDGKDGDDGEDGEDGDDGDGTYCHWGCHS